jgi:hypothetical protein
MNRPAVARVRAAVLRAWVFVGVFAVLAAAVYVFAAARMPYHHSIPLFRNVVLGYAAGATAAAAIVAVLEPWRTTRLRDWAVGVIAAWPWCYLGLGLLAIGFTLNPGRAVVITVAACVSSAIISGRNAAAIAMRNG